MKNFCFFALMMTLCACSHSRTLSGRRDIASRIDNLPAMVAKAKLSLNVTSGLIPDPFGDDRSVFENEIKNPTAKFDELYEKYFPNKTVDTLRIDNLPAQMGKVKKALELTAHKHPDPFGDDRSVFEDEIKNPTAKFDELYEKYFPLNDVDFKN